MTGHSKHSSESISESLSQSLEEAEDLEDEQTCWGVLEPEQHELVVGLRSSPLDADCSDSAT